MTWEELLPWYEETDQQFGVSGLGGNPVYPDCAAPPLPPLPINEAGLRLARAHAALGWHWWPATNAIASVNHGEQRPCVQRGTCGQGCNEGAKGSTDRTHWTDAVRAGVQLRARARVRRLLMDDPTRCVGVEWIDSDGGVHQQYADIVLLAANAIGTSRLLLASADGGVANSSGLVGRNLMLHPLSTVVGVFDDDLRGWRAHNGALIQSMQFARSEASRGFLRGSTWGLGTSSGPLRSLFTPDPSGVWGDRHLDHVTSRLGHLAQWAILCEDLPEFHNRIELDPDTSDSDGMPGVRVHYELSDNSRRMMSWMIERAGESLLAAGARTIESTPHLANGHLMGTTRMGRDRSSSVTDEWGMTHDVANLGIVDGGVFVTSGSANPTSTIAALALRTADHIVRTHVPRAMHPPMIGSQRTADESASTSSGDGTDVRITDPTAPPAADFTEAHVARFAAIADELIVARGPFPRPSDLDLSALLATVLSARPDLAAPLLDTLSGTDDVGGHLEKLSADDPGGLHALRYAVAGAYYLDPRVRTALDYLPEDVSPVVVDHSPDYISEGLLDHLFAQ